jgi:hypothetical protein
VDASNPLSCSLQYAGNTLDLAFGNNVTIKYRPITDELIVYATRAVKKDEPIGITLGQEYWCAMEWNLPTLIRAQNTYAAQEDPLWIDLLYRKRKQLHGLLNEGDGDGDAESTSSTDDEGEEKAASAIRQETWDWTTAYTSQPRSTAGMGLEYDHPYGGEILAAQEVIRNSDLHHKSLFFNISGKEHRDQ